MVESSPTLSSGVVVHALGCEVVRGINTLHVAAHAAGAGATAPAMVMGLGPRRGWGIEARAGGAPLRVESVPRCQRAPRGMTTPASQGELLLRRGPIARQMGERLRIPLQELYATAAATAMDDEGAQLAGPP
jgi:hypothetical protein